MKLEELQKKIEQDLPIRPDEIETSMIDNMKLYSEYLQLLSVIRIELRQQLNNLNETRLRRYVYYSGKDHENVFEFCLTPTEMKVYMSGDAEINRAELLLELSRAKVELVEEGLKAIRDRSFAIKNIIELRKLEAGM